MWKFDESKLVIARQMRDLTQTDLANMIGGSQQQVASWESGAVKPGQESLCKVCEVLGTTPKFFFIEVLP